MTPAEIVRAIESKNRVVKRQAQERASFDYILANLICKGVSITLGSKESFPRITEAYPGLFDAEAKAKEEEIKQHKMDLSALRFKQFAQSYNMNYQKGGAK